VFYSRTWPTFSGASANIYTLNVELKGRYRYFAGASMPLFRSKSAKEKPLVKYHISDNDYYWLASRFCQNMMAFVFAATRFDEDRTAYFEHFFIDFLERRGISYSIVEIDEANKQLCIFKPWEKGVTK
jgi:hypothetical protein